MVDAGLLARKKKLTVAEIQENLQTVLGAEADASATMASLGLSGAIEGQEHQTVQLTQKKLKELITTHALTEAQAQEFAMRTGVTLSMNAQTASTLPKWIATIKAATVAVWDQVKATAVWLTTTPAGWATAAIAAIGGIIFAYSKLTKSTEKANEATKEAIDTFESLMSEVENLENKLSDLNEQIGKLDPITNEKDLENLKAKTTELETQLAILREKQRIAGDEADKAAQKSLGMTQASRYKTVEYESAYGGMESTAAYVTKDKELLNAIEAYEEYKIKVDEANKALADMAETGTYTQKEWLKQEKIVSTYSKKMDNARSHANELVVDLNEQKHGLNGNTEASMELLNTVDSTIERYKEWLDVINGTTGALEEQTQAEENLSDEKPISSSISDTISQLNTKLKPAMDSLKSAWQDIFTNDEFALNSIDILSTCDSIKSKLDELNKIEGITVDYSSYEDFVRVLRDSESTTNDVKEAFNSLATSITQAALSGAEDFETMKAALEDLGVVNSEMVAFDALISNTEALKEAGLDLTTATDEQIKKFAKEHVATENLEQAINMLTRQKMLSALENMDTSTEVSNMIALAKQAGMTSEVIANLTELKKIYQKIASGTITSDHMLSHYADRAEELKQLITDEITKVDYTPKVDFSHIEKATKKAEIDFTDLLDKELTVLDKKMEAGYIDFNDYIKARLALIEDYYVQGKN